MKRVFVSFYRLNGVAYRNVWGELLQIPGECTVVRIVERVDSRKIAEELNSGAYPTIAVDGSFAPSYTWDEQARRVQFYIPA